MTVDKLERLPGVYRADTPAPQVVAAVIAKANANGNGQVEAAELERLLRGWSLDQHDALRGSQRDRADERRRLAGAKERAERSTAEAGGFAGLTDASEALAIGEAAQRVQAAEKFVFMESEPTAFAGGAHYALDKAAAAALATVETETVARCKARRATAGSCENWHSVCGAAHARGCIRSYVRA